jgi:hypothetical protein
MGASRGRLIRQLLTESLLLAAIGGVCASLLAGGLSRAFVALLDTHAATTLLVLGLDWRVLVFTTGLSLLTCVLFGLAPAMSATRVSASSVMRASGRGATSGREAVGLRRTLVIAQVALSVVLLFGSLLFARSLRSLVTMDPGFKADGIITAGVTFRRLELPVDRRGLQAGAAGSHPRRAGDSGGRDDTDHPGQRQLDRQQRLARRRPVTPVRRAVQFRRERLLRHAGHPDGGGPRFRRGGHPAVPRRRDRERDVRIGHRPAWRNRRRQPIHARADAVELRPRRSRSSAWSRTRATPI